MRHPPHGNNMTNGFDINALFDWLANRVADLVVSRLRGNGNLPIGPRLLTVEQGAEYYGRTKAAMDHLIAAGIVPVVRIDRRVMIDIRDLDKLIDNQKQ
jgi:hypothetical protein